MAGLIAIAIMATILSEFLFVDFVHGNPHRTRQNVIAMMLLDPPIFGLIAVTGGTLAFGLSQCVQALAFRALVHRFGGLAELFMLMIWPVAAVIT